MLMRYVNVSGRTCGESDHLEFPSSSKIFMSGMDGIAASFYQLLNSCGCRASALAFLETSLRWAELTRTPLRMLMRNKTKRGWFPHLLAWLAIADGVDGLINIASFTLNLIS